VQKAHPVIGRVFLFQRATSEGVKDFSDEKPVHKTISDVVDFERFDEVQEHVSIFRGLFLVELPPLQIGRFRLAHDAIVHDAACSKLAKKIEGRSAQRPFTFRAPAIWPASSMLKVDFSVRPMVLPIALAPQTISSLIAVVMMRALYRVLAGPGMKKPRGEHNVNLCCLLSA
jgi:hypothetical protein